MKSNTGISTKGPGGRNAVLEARKYRAKEQQRRRINRAHKIIMGLIRLSRGAV